MRTGRPRTVDWYERKRDRIFEGLDRVMREQRTRILQLGAPTSHWGHDHEDQREYLERRHRIQTLGPALAHFEDINVISKG